MISITSSPIHQSTIVKSNYHHHHHRWVCGIVANNYFVPFKILQVLQWHSRVAILCGWHTLESRTQEVRTARRCTVRGKWQAFLTLPSRSKTGSIFSVSYRATHRATNRTTNRTDNRTAIRNWMSSSRRTILPTPSTDLPELLPLCQWNFVRTAMPRWITVRRIAVEL